MMAIHTELAAIFGGMNVNEAELKIQYIKYRPSLPYDSKSPITLEETDEYGNPPTTDPTCAKRLLDYEGEEEATPPPKTIKKDTSVDEEDPHSGRRENGLCSHRGIAEEQSGTRQVMVSDVEDYLEEAEHRWKKSPESMDSFLY